ncbi:MAG: hypothetical protein KGS72_17905 [Cyanobacteria bacterium REEB67]|nr:hypothetical protein [Cyanobacteria bacterium REEB67]
MISLANSWLRFRAAMVAVFTALVCSLPALAQTLSAEKQQEVDALTKQIAANGSDYSLYAKRGFIYLHGRINDAAEDDFDKALNLNPKWQKGYIFRAEYFLGKGLPADAVGQMNEAEKIAPLKPSMIAWRGTMYAQMKNYRAAIDEFSKALVLDPRDYKTYTSRAFADFDLNGPSASVQRDLESSLAINPDYEVSRKFLEEIKRQLALRGSIK